MLLHIIVVILKCRLIVGLYDKLLGTIWISYREAINCSAWMVFIHLSQLTSIDIKN